MPKPSSTTKLIKDIKTVATYGKKPKSGVVFVGADPGKQGGIVVVHTFKDISPVRTWHLMPTGEMDLLTLFRSEVRLTTKDKVVIGIERVSSMPGEGHAGAFTFGEGYGGLKMAAMACDFERILIPPRTWQAFFKIKARGKRTKAQFKDEIRQAAHSKFPDIPLWKEPRTKGKQLAICDAMFIAEYVRLTYK